MKFRTKMNVLKNALKSFLVLSIVFLTTNCTTPSNADISDTQTIKIAISKTSGSSSYEQYSRWILTADSTVEIIDMYHQNMDSLQKILESVDGIILSGGEDVNPELYFAGERGNHCEKLDTRRDTIEYLMMDYAFRNKMPVLGICRGQQIINVFLGGDLITDIPTFKPSPISHRCQRADTCRHSIKIISDNLLYQIVKGDTTNISVNSSHHQAIKIIAATIQPLAIAPDGIIESIGWVDTNNRSFLLGVQFHPEHLDFQHPLSGKIAKKFINEAKRFKEK
ncbi:MAG: gamma-glutamyl-gamma-aminobutyrate hydrolase family protein [Bacteroidales bacterium]|nr:gamma-glutamyl-gamma-aminobutyrate hydrolase family protein [Bacteroidales bacterium]